MKNRLRVQDVSVYHIKKYREISKVMIRELFFAEMYPEKWLPKIKNNIDFVKAVRNLFICESHDPPIERISDMHTHASYSVLI